MTLENQAFEDVSPIKHHDLPANHVSFSEGGYHVETGCSFPCPYKTGIPDIRARAVQREPPPPPPKKKDLPDTSKNRG